MQLLQEIFRGRSEIADGWILYPLYREGNIASCGFVYDIGHTFHPLFAYDRKRILHWEINVETTAL